MGEAVEGMYCFASTVVDGKVDITLEDGTIVTKDELLTVTFQHRTKVLNAVLTVLNAVLFWLTVLTADCAYCSLYSLCSLLCSVSMH